MENFELRIAFRQYCIDNKLCSAASNNQFDKMLDIISRPIADPRTFDFLASMVWICSNTDKTIDKISDELLDMFFKNL